MSVRVCNKCGNEKPLSEFQISHDGYRRHFCKDCRKAQLRVSGAQWRERNREKYTAYHEKYRIENAEKIKAHRDANRPPLKRKIYSVINGKKECSDCALILELKDFYPTVSPKRKTYYSHKCRKCTHQYLLNLVGEKECPRCNTVKQYSEFRPNKEWYDRYCKPCRAEMQMEKYYNDPEWRRSHIESSSKSAKKHRVKRTESLTRWKARNPDKVKAKRIAYLPRHRENNKKYIQKHKDRIYPKRRAWAKKIRDDVDEKYIKYYLRHNKKMKDIPKEIIQATQQLIKLKREIKTKKII